MISQLSSFSIDIPFKRIYNRMGRRVSTEVSGKMTDEIDAVIREAFLLCEMKACYGIFPVEKNDGNKLILAGETFVSKDFCKLVEHCSMVAIFADTIGSRLLEKRQELVKKDMLRAVIYDATGSEIAEEGAEYMHAFLGKIVASKGRAILKRRFSPGYSDMSLEMQRPVFKLLEPEDIGITLSASCLMTPEKSVTAFVGVE